MVLGIHDITLPGIWDTIHFTSRDMGYYPFYFQGFNILFTFRDIGFMKTNYGYICQFLRDTCLFTSRVMGYLVLPIQAFIVFAI